MFDYKALENFMIKFSESNFVGYPIPELFGASKTDSVVSQVFRMKIFLSLVLLAYSLFFISLYSIEENSRRLKFLFRGISIPLFLLIVSFWLKFLGEDHIVVKSEKNELFIATTVSLVFSILLFAYSFRSQKKKRSMVAGKLSQGVSASSVEQHMKPNGETQLDPTGAKELTPIPAIETELPDQKPADEISNDFPIESDLTPPENTLDTDGMASNREVGEELKDTKESIQQTAVNDTVSENLVIKQSNTEENLQEKEPQEEDINPNKNQEDGITSPLTTRTEVSENEQIHPLDTSEENEKRLIKNAEIL
jgi:hypothetical protein